MNIDQSAICCKSIDSFRQALQTNEKLFSNFGISFEWATLFKNNSGLHFFLWRSKGFHGSWWVCNVRMLLFCKVNIFLHYLVDSSYIASHVTSLPIFYSTVILYSNNYSVSSGYFSDNIFLHFCASMISGLVTTAASMPVDIAKTRSVIRYLGLSLNFKVVYTNGSSST